MRKQDTRTFLLIFHFFACTLLLQAQSQKVDDTYYAWFDQQVGIENTGLYKGVLYKDLYRTINENTQYFKSPNFMKGDIVYKGQVYSNLELKYNVYEDQVLLKILDRLGGNTMQLFKEKITGFNIDGHSFTHIRDAPLNSGVTGFYEISLQYPAFTLLTKHRKKLFDRKDRSSLYYEFLPLKKEHIVYRNGRYFPIVNKRDVTDIFPEIEDEIDAFYNRARTQRRTDPHAFTLSLMQRIGSLLLQNNSLSSQ